MGELRAPGKPFGISKWAVWEAWEKVKANKGAPGVDGQSIAEFEKDLQGSLYKIWNRMSSGSYFPPPVRAVEIAKAHGAGTRMLGVPTVADRVAQTAVAQELEAKVGPIFHPDSYGYRPRRSALDAVAACRRRCWQTNWVIDLDIARFFDSVPWDRVVTAVEANTDLPWVVLYVKRWLHAPVQLADGSLQVRHRGTPQGSAISPVLANLFLHYAFDVWLTREFSGVRFERYVDDAVVHCISAAQAHRVLAALVERMREVGLELHPEKTRALGQSGRARLDELLRRVLPIGAVSPPGAHQRLPDELAPQQVQTTAWTQKGAAGLGRGRRDEGTVLRPLGLGNCRSRRLVTRTRRAV